MYPIDFFWRTLVRAPDRPAVISADGALSYRMLAAKVTRRAAALVARDPAPGSRVALGAANTAEHLIALLAIMAAGKIWVPLNPRNGDAELLRIVSFVKPSLILADDDMLARLEPGGGPLASLSILEEGGGDPTRLPMGPYGIASIALETAQAIKFTGGSTGAPKAVQQPLRAWNTNIATQLRELGLRADDRYLVAAPITHGTGTYMLPMLGAGGTLVFPDHPKPAEMLDAIAAHGVTLFFAPATLIMALADAQRQAPRDLSSLRYVIYGGAPMRPDQIREAQAVFGPVICTTYGQTEAPQIATFLPPHEMNEQTIASVGRPTFLTKIAIIDENGAPLPPGETGEIALRGDLVMSDYLDAPEATRKTIVDGWLRTGDAGAFDENGYLFLRDRLRDVIITGGFNVYPSDVETVLSRHPAVADCAVVGIPDPKWGEAVHAAVQLRPGTCAAPEELMALVKAELGSVKTPKHIHFMAQLPRSPLAKVMKAAIRDEICRRGTPS